VHADDPSEQMEIRYKDEQVVMQLVGSMVTKILLYVEAVSIICYDCLQLVRRMFALQADEFDVKNECRVGRNDTPKAT
jgi:hypothetical protein